MQHLLTVNAPPLRAATVRLHLGNRRLRRKCLVQLEDRRTLLGIPRVGLTLAGWVSHRGTQLVPHRRRLLQQSNRITHGLRHLRLPVEPNNPTRWRQTRLRLREKGRIGREPRIPVARDHPRQLQMLNLILADRHGVRTVQQDVRRLEHGIVQQPGHNLLLPRRFFLELCLPLELAERRHRIENPRELRVLRHL